MKIAVTSASGKLGSAILKQLILETGGQQLIGIARTPSKAKHLGIPIKKGDYNRYDHFLEALKGVEVVVILSGMDAPELRIEQHRNIISAAKDCGVRKVVYTSIIGEANQTAFNPVIQSNRKTEKDLMLSGLDWVIGRNGLYIEPDLDYINHYRKDGEISNSAGDGRCAYTSRLELACAYAQMALDNKHNENIYNLVGRSITQHALAMLINQVYGTDLKYKPMPAEAYYAERKEALGEYLGSIIGGIYESIRKGLFHPTSDFRRACGRPHLTPLEMIQQIKDLAR